MAQNLKNLIELAGEGSAVWNEWIVNSSVTQCDFSGVNFIHAPQRRKISFKGFVFPVGTDFSGAEFYEGLFEFANFLGDVSFEGALFERNAKFMNAVFKGKSDFQRTFFKADAGFQGAKFEKSALFMGATFSKHLSLSESAFKSDVNFLGTTFLGSISFEGSSFETVPDLRRSEFKKHVTFHRMSLKYKNRVHEDDADKYRRLKELAVTGRDHDKEQEYFAYELKAKRTLELTGFDYLINLLYEIVSDYGRSISRPFAFLVATWSLFAIYFTASSDKVSEVSRGMIYSLNLLIPFLPGGLKRIERLEDELFSQPALMSLGAWPVIEGFLGVVLVFLIVLGLRNRFRI